MEHIEDDTTETHATKVEDRRLPKPPHQDQRLLDFFTGHDLAPKSLHGAFEAMSATSFARGVPDPDARLVNTGAVGFIQRTEGELLDRMGKTLEHEDDPLQNERVSRAQKHRETATLLSRLTPRQVRILQLAYGPQDQVPGVKLGRNPPVGKEHVEEGRQYEVRKKLESWRQVLPETVAAPAAFESWKLNQKPEAVQGITLVRWLVEIATRKEHVRTLSAIQTEAYLLVQEAHAAWAELRGRRRFRRDDPPFEREEVKPWE